MSGNRERHGLTLRITVVYFIIVRSSVQDSVGNQSTGVTSSVEQVRTRLNTLLPPLYHFNIQTDIYFCLEFKHFLLYLSSNNNTYRSQSSFSTV